MSLCTNLVYLCNIVAIVGNYFCKCEIINLNKKIDHFRKQLYQEGMVQFCPLVDIFHIT